MARTNERTFVTVSVTLTEAEYRSLRAERALTTTGTSSQAVRERMGLTGRPYGSTKPHQVLTEAQYEDAHAIRNELLDARLRRIERENR